MATSTTYIIQTADDGYTTAATGSGAFTQSSMMPVLGSAGWTAYLFQDVAIPQGATINSASLNVYGASGSTAPATGTLMAELASTGTFPTSANNATAKDKTTHTVEWTVSSTSGWANSYHASPDIADIVQEIVSQVGWTSGNDILILISQASGGTMYGYDYQSSNVNETYLTVDYTAASGTTYYGEISEVIGVGDGLLPTSMMETVYESIGVGEIFDTNMREVVGTAEIFAEFIGTFQYTLGLSLGAGASDEIIGSFQYEGAATSLTSVDDAFLASFQYSFDVAETVGLSDLFEVESFIGLSGDWELQYFTVEGSFRASWYGEMTGEVFVLAGTMGELLKMNGALVLEFPYIHATEFNGFVAAGLMGSVAAWELEEFALAGRILVGRVYVGSLLLRPLEAEGTFGARGEIALCGFTGSGVLTVDLPVTGLLSLLPLQMTGTLTLSGDGWLTGAWTLRIFSAAGALRSLPLLLGAMQLRKFVFSGSMRIGINWQGALRLQQFTVSGGMARLVAGAGGLLLYAFTGAGSLRVATPATSTHRIVTYKNGIYGAYKENKVGVFATIEGEIES